MFCQPRLSAGHCGVCRARVGHGGSGGRCPRSAGTPVMCPGRGSHGEGGMLLMVEAIPTCVNITSQFHTFTSFSLYKFILS